MGKFFAPIILIGVVVALYFLWISPTYGEVKQLRERQVTLQDALEKEKQVQSLIAALKATYDAIPAEQTDRLKKMVPDNIDNIRLLIEINTIAARYGLTIDTLNIPPRPAEQAGLIGTDASGGYGTFAFSFAVHGPYDQMVVFFSEMASNLRLSDVAMVTFGPDTGATERRDVYTAGVTLNTYWLR